MSPSSSGRSGLPSREEIYQAISSFTNKQKITFLALLALFFSSCLGILWLTNNLFLADIAVPGGALSEGIIGAPSHINPLLAVTDADRDLSMLVYSGLMRIGSDGKLLPDLAQSYSVSPNGLIYSFTLRPGLSWQDGKPLTSDDVAFTVLKAQDPSVKSPKRANWEGVQVVADNPDKITFILKKPYASFLDNTTLGILPKHLWQDVKGDAWPLSDFNIKPVGSGPYQVSRVGKDASGLPLYYSLTPFDNFALGSAKISNLTLRFYGNEDDLKAAYEQGEVESLGAISPDLAVALQADGAKITKIGLPRIFAVFFNQSETGVLSNLAVRQALALATDKKTIVENILKNDAVVINNLVPPGSLGYITEKDPPVFDLEKAETLLEQSGWTAGVDGIRQKRDKNKTARLQFSITVPNVKELKAVANLMKSTWQKIGADVSVNVFETGDLDLNVIRPRKFDVLIFGEIVGRNPDLYSFWHSSQRHWPGLNIVGYANMDVDKVLESLRQTADPDAAQANYENVQALINKDEPAIPLYAPFFLYLLPDKIHGAEFPSLVVQAERFASVYQWYINRERVWKIFVFHRPAEK